MPGRSLLTTVEEEEEEEEGEGGLEESHFINLGASGVVGVCVGMLHRSSRSE